MIEPPQPKKQATLTDLLKQDVKVPMWVLVCLTSFAVCAGCAYGLLVEDGSLAVVEVAALGVAFLLAPFVVGVVKRLSRFKRDASGVSPVIGVILMVAVTVVLAAAVFTIVGRMASNQQAAPQMQFTTDDQGASWLLIAAPNGLDWSEFTVTGCTVPTGSVDAGDTLTGCTPPVTVSHKATNTVVFRGE